MEFKGEKKIHTHLNIAPLIDVVFLLLIFFMLSADFITHPGIKISLPTAVSAKLHPEEEIIIFISENNKLYLNEEPVALENLVVRLRAKIEEFKAKTVIIKADEKINLGLAVKVMDMAKQAEAKGLVISTILKEEDVRR